MKGLFKEDVASILPHLLQDAQYINGLDIEVLRAPMRVDRVYLIRYKGQLHILHLEFQAGPDEDMAHRLHVYHANLWRDHKLPVITIVIYLFEASLPESPLKETDADGEVLIAAGDWLLRGSDAAHHCALQQTRSDFAMTLRSNSAKNS